LNPRPTCLYHRSVWRNDSTQQTIRTCSVDARWARPGRREQRGPQQQTASTERTPAPAGPGGGGGEPARNASAAAPLPPDQRARDLRGRSASSGLPARAGSCGSASRAPRSSRPCPSGAAAELSAVRGRAASWKTHLSLLGRRVPLGGATPVGDRLLLLVRGLDLVSHEGQVAAARDDNTETNRSRLGDSGRRKKSY
jgi:hypothetical protein